MQTTEMLYTTSKRNELVYNIISGAYNFDMDTLTEYNIKFPHPYTTIILFRLDNAKKIKHSDIAVSYTHLDVYKRQEQSSRFALHKR